MLWLQVTVITNKGGSMSNREMMKHTRAVLSEAGCTNPAVLCCSRDDIDSDFVA
jgi:hypothetical protein